MDIDLPVIWAFLLATAVFLYVVMDGFDLGVGILFPAERGKADRDMMVNTIAPFWDGNETWLVLGGGGLLAVFPMAYSILMPALYMPVIVMLLALVFRGVAFEMRFKAETKRTQRFWDWSFSGGSYVAALCQGIMLGAIVQGIEVSDRAYAGGWWDWLTPFSVFTGAAVICGYGLMGACWLHWKLEGELQDRVKKQARILALAMLAFVFSISALMPFLQPAFFDRWLAWPNMLYAAPVPVLVSVLAWRLLTSLAKPYTRTAPEERLSLWHDGTPFLATLGLFLLCYVGLGINLWPHIIPPSVTIWAAAASPSSQGFLLVGAVVLVPTILAYTAYVYWLFRGKVRADEAYH